MRQFSFIALLGLLSIICAPRAFADGLTDLNSTSDSITVTVIVPGQDTFNCDSEPTNFFCTDPTGFICYGWSNCSALDATGNAPNLETFLETTFDNDGDPTNPTPNSVAPEPTLILLLSIGLAALLLRSRATRLRRCGE